MVQIIIIDDEWQKEVLEIAQKFNEYAKKQSMRMMSFLLDKAFNILSDDKHPGNADAAKMLKRIRNLNPELITPYVSTLIDAKFEKALLESDEFIVPNYMKYPVSTKPDDDIVVYSDESEKKEQIKEVETIDVEEKTKPQEIKSELFSWDMFELLKFGIIKNLSQIAYSEIQSPIKKCACGDGVFERNETNIWRCTECGTAYHENCAKLVSLLEGNCRICEEPFLIEDIKEKEDKKDKAEN